MKKLIDELESLKNEYPSDKTISAADNDIRFGIERAIEIVRAHNPWHEVAELPERDEKADDCSINVWVTDGERRNIGFYDFAENVWIFGKAYGKVTH